MRLIMIPALLASLVACGEADRTATIVGLSGDSANGETLYSSTCAACHGADGSGGGSYPALAGLSISDEAKVDIILYGDGSMPSYEDSYEDQDIADILAYINTL